MSIILSKQREFFVGIDSDGCAFDTMELKHKECFIPNTINHYNLQPISKYAREAAEFVNLYSTDRGINRFPALVKTLAWLAKRPEVANRGWRAQPPQGLVEWLGRENAPNNRSLLAAIQSATNDEATEIATTENDAIDDLRRALAWSEEVNRSIAEMVHGVPPFPLVAECLQRLSGIADVVVVSATPGEALQREWSEHGLREFVAAICGQESGSKSEILAAALGYEPQRVLMIGDAPGDLNAAKANGALFFPIQPGAEEESWRQFHHEGLDRFLNGKYTADYQQELVEAFQKRLPETPPWPVV